MAGETLSSSIYCTNVVSRDDTDFKNDIQTTNGRIPVNKIQETHIDSLNQLLTCRQLATMILQVQASHRLH